MAFTTAYCTDEDIAIKNPGDFLAIIPSDQRIADFTDGVIVGWALSSITANFATRGAAAGMLVHLKKPSSYGVSGDLLIVDSLVGGVMNLRRKGFATGEGEPPAPLTGITGSVLTARPQIRDASYNLNKLYGVDDLWYGRRYLDLYDPAELSDVCAMMTMYQLYLSEARRSTKDDHWWAKAAMVKKDLDELIKSVAIHWAQAAPGESESSPFSTTVVRG